MGMEAGVVQRRVYRFGLFQVDAEQGKLLRKGSPVKLQEQPLRVLNLLLEHRGEIVSREQLRQSLWPEGTYVEFDGSLNAALKRLRFALGDDAENPLFIETVPRRGYRFIAPVELESPAEVAPPQVQGRDPEPVTLSASRSRRLRAPGWWIGLVAVPAALGLTILAWYFSAHQHPAVASRKVIAVLPFSNLGAGSDLDYLRYAIANDLVTDLTYAGSVTVRPFASTSKYGSQSATPETVGKELSVSHVVTGGFLLENQTLRVSMELVDVAQNQSIWREELAVSPRELVALHDRLADRAANAILPAMNVSKTYIAKVPAPKNEQALELFLHSLTVSLDPEPNQLAIKTLQESLALDSTYAPAWGELGWRYYIDYHYGNGGDAAVAKALQAYKRESELHPDMPAVSTTIRVEQGDLSGAYRQAAEYLRRHPDVSLAHYSMSYVLRYAGLLAEAGKECDSALAIDPGFNVFRSCATPFTLLGDYAHAETYLRLDEHSGVAALFRMIINLRSGNRSAALADSDAASRTGSVSAEFASLYLHQVPPSELKQAAVKVENDPKSSRDPEELFRNAEILSVAGQTDPALRELRKAIKGNYCSYPAVDNDPLFDPVRQRQEFAEIRQLAMECQQKFMAQRRQIDAAMNAH